MPRSIANNEKMIRERIKLTRDAGLECWLMWFGIPGPDESLGTANAVGTNHIDRVLKYEMHELLGKEPELFGSRDPLSCNWRGSRPLCLSNSKVKLFYQGLVKRLCVDFPEINGIIFFPGDHNPDMCDHTCPRCSLQPSRWQIYTEHLNGLPKYSMNMVQI